MRAIVLARRSSKSSMRAGILVFLFASIACRAQELRFVYPVPAPTDFTQRSNLIYKQTGQTELSLDFFLPSRSAPSKPLPVFVIFNGFGGTFMRTSPQSLGWAKAATAHGFAAITAETTPEHVSAGLPAVEDPQRKAIKAAVIYYGWADVPQIRLDLPVLFVRAGLDQPLTNQSVDRGIAAGIAANAPWTVLNYPGGRHGF